jgi:hypothetical protein
MADGFAVAEWPRNSREIVRVSLTTYNGHPVVDIRTWYRDRAGDTKPGRAGLTLGMKHLPDLADALARALAEATARGLV